MENFHRAKSIENKRLILAVLWHARREKFKMYRHFRQKNLFLSILFFLIEPFSVTGDALFEFRIFIMLIFYPWNFIQFVKACYASSFPNKAIQREVMNIRNSSIALERFLLILFYYYYFSLNSSYPKSFCALPHYCIWIINISTSFSTINAAPSPPCLFPSPPPTPH